MQIHVLRMALAIPLAVPALASAQADAADPALAAPGLTYHSVLRDYKPWQDVSPGDWKQANTALLAPTADAPRQTGGAAPAGHGSHAAEPAPGGQASHGGHGPGGPGSSTRHDGHGGHPMHGGQR